MSIKLSQGFNVTSREPIDKRFVLTKAQMLSTNDSLMPVRYFAICSDDGLLYIYDKNTETPSAETGKFAPVKVAADGQSIVLNDNGLSIKGYDSATQGQMLVKDQTNGLTWVNPVSDASLQQAVQQAQASATQAGTSATVAGNYAGQAIEAKTAIENKIWYGTMAQYNALETVSKSTLYFILDGSLSTEA